MKVSLVMGLPGCGKTSVVKEKFKGVERLNRDELGGKMERLLPVLEHLLQQDKDVVMDNLFTAAADRRPFIELAQFYNAEVEAFHITTSPEDCQFNICKRMVQKHGRILTPEELKKSKDPNMLPTAALFSAVKKFEKPDPSEGLSAVHKVPFERVMPGYINRAIILDYDGTLRKTKSGAKFPTDPSDIEVFVERGKELKARLDDGWLLLGASNQSGIASGKLTETQARACFDYTNRNLGVDIDYSFDGSRVPPLVSWRRKPMPGMGVEFIEKYQLNAPDCIMVGDMKSDETFARRCGFQYCDADRFFVH